MKHMLRFAMVLGLFILLTLAEACVSFPENRPKAENFPKTGAGSPQSVAMRVAISSFTNEKEKETTYRAEVTDKLVQALDRQIADDAFGGLSHQEAALLFTARVFKRADGAKSFKLLKPDEIVEADRTYDVSMEFNGGYKGFTKALFYISAFTATIVPYTAKQSLRMKVSVLDHSGGITNNYDSVERMNVWAGIVFLPVRPFVSGYSEGFLDMVANLNSTILDRMKADRLF